MSTKIERKRDYDAARYRDRRAHTAIPDIITTLSKTTLAYLAGLTDGDGTIFVTHTNRLRTYYPAVVWAMIHRETIDTVASLLDGTTVVLNNHTNLRRCASGWGGSRVRPQYRTSVTGKRAVLLCAQMLPYLITKRAQAELVAQFPADGRRAPGLRLADGVIEQRLELAERLTLLNRG